MKRLILILFIANIFFSSCERTGVKGFQNKSFVKFFGNYNKDKGYDVIQTNDEGYVLVGEIENTEHADTDLLIIKTDQTGNQQWVTQIGNEYNESGRSIIETEDNSYVILGNTSDSIDGHLVTDLLLIKIDAQGNEIWRNILGSPHNETAVHLQYTSDGGFVLLANTNKPSVRNPDGSINALLIKTNEKGDSLWARTFGEDKNVYASAVRQKNDGGYIMTGSTADFAEPGQGGSNIIIIETNTNGIEIDKITYGGVSDDFGEDVHILPDGYAVVGTTSSYGDGEQVFLLKTGKLIHEMKWIETYGGGNSDRAAAFTLKGDEGFVIAGTTSSYNSVGFDFYFVMTDNSGVETDFLVYGSEGEEQSKGIDLTDDGGLIVIGYSEFKENSMISLLKTTPDGQLNVP